MRAAGLLLVGLSIVAAGACAPAVDLSTALRTQTVVSGWVDDGIVQGKKKIVPTISVSIRNVSTQTLEMLQVNALFRRVGDEDEWGAHFLTVAGREGLPPGGMTMVSVKSPQGYTSADSGRAMLTNSQFVDARVDLYAKYGSTRWTRVAQYRIARQLLAR